MAGKRDPAAAVQDRRRLEAATVELVSGTGSRFEEYAKEWITSFNDALDGDYDAERFVSDASRMTSRLIRDAAHMFVSGFEFLDAVSKLPAPAEEHDGGRGRGANDT
jgi:hypothetical protein